MTMTKKPVWNHTDGPADACCACGLPLTGWGRFAAVLFVCLWTAPLLAQDAEEVDNDDTPRAELGQSFDEQSIALRTALHNDPSLASPLERLVSLYREAGRLKELAGLYSGHLRQYPNDANGHTVLVRLMIVMGDPGALTAAQKAAEQFPDNAFLRHVLFELLKLRNDGQAIAELDKAIELETRPTRRMAWLEELLPEADLRDRRDLALKHLKAFAELPRNAQQRLAIGRLTNRYRFHALALQVLSKSDATPAPPELMVDIELESASAEVGLDKPDAAADRLEKLLGRLTGDYWRRPDIVRRRLALITSPDRRDEIIGVARKRVAAAPRDEAAALDLAQTLAAVQFRREALAALLAAGERMPDSKVIEQRTLDMFDRLREERGREEYLKARLEAFPKRSDLALLRIKSQYLLGRREAADQLFEQLIEPMGAKDQAVQVLEMARFLRRSNLTIEAADWFSRCLELDSDQLDVRRELAETRLALGQRHKITEAFEGAVPAEAPVEEVLDLVQFMLQQKLLIEAGELIRERLQVDEQNLDLLLLLISVERRMGRLGPGTALIERTRELADTGARYRVWLEAAVQFIDEFDATEPFLLNEERRLQAERGEWTDRQLERRLAFAEVASSNDLTDSAAALLKGDLTDELTPVRRLAIRRKLIDILKDDAAHFVTVEAELNRLAEEDPQSISAYSAQLALLQKRLNREDRAVEFLQKVDPKQIRDATVLSSLLSTFKHRLDYGQLMTDILERLTQLNPGDRGVWEQWLTVLAAKSDEEGLRVELRRLLSGIKELTLDEEARELLQLYMADSYWRSISRELTGGKTGAFADILPLLDAIERMVRDDQQWLWMTWIRAYALNRVGNTAARDEAIGELERIVTMLTVSTGDPLVPAIEPRIVFPDGVSVSVQQARMLLSKAEPESTRFPIQESVALVPPFQAQWKWSAGHAVTSIRPVGIGRVLIGDRTGRVSCVDVATGKQLWHRDTLLTTGTGGQNQNANYFNPQMAKATASRPGYQIIPLAGSENGEPDRFCTSGQSSVSCYSLKDGQLLWRADVGATARKPGSKWSALNASQPGVSIFPEDDGSEILTWDPMQSTLARIDTANGKILWYSTIAGASGSHMAFNSGATLHGNHLLVYGTKTAILDVITGDTVWSFEAQKLRSFPVNLDENKTTAGLTNPGRSYRSVSSQQQQQMQIYLQSNPMLMQQLQMQIQTGMMTSTQAQAMVLQQMTGGSTLSVNPWQFSRQNPLVLSSGAVSWASNAQRGTASHARLLDSKLVLFQNGQVQTIDLDVPLAGHTAVAQGILVGLSGRVACMLSTNSDLNFVDLTAGSIRTYQPTEILPEVGKVPTVRVHATMQGMLVYLTGQRGIQCVNVRSGEAIFSVPWPANVEPAYVATRQVATRQVAGNLGLAAPPIRYAGGGMAYPYPGTSSPVVHKNPTTTSTVATIHNGILYTLSADDTVVALKGASLDGR